VRGGFVMVDISTTCPPASRLHPIAPGERNTEVNTSTIATPQIDERIVDRKVERAEATFADGGEVYIEEKELELLLTREKAWKLGLDSEYQYLIVGVHWDALSRGLVLLPDFVSRPGRPEHTEPEEVSDASYSRVQHIDNAIAVLMRTRALLTTSGSEAQA